jgi:hypothetical protein
MKSCEGCKYAEWKRTRTGALHPDKSGRCTFKVSIPILPACRSWMWGVTPSFTTDGYISRGSEFNDHCPCYCPEEKP